MSESENVLVSVIIPTAGRSSIFAAVESVRQQNHPSVEILVVQDGTDEVTKAALEQHFGSGLRVLTQQPPKGAPAARNLGASQALGKYVALLDDDDLFLPGKLAADLHAATNQIDDNFIVICSALVEWEGRYEKWPRRFPLPGEPWSDYLFGRSWPARRSFLQSSCLFFPRTLIRRVPMNEELRQHQDWDWLLTLEANQTRLVPIHEAYVRYEITHPGTSISTRTRWMSSLAWLKSHQHSFSRETYSFFIANHVMDKAVAQDGFFPDVLLKLLREFCLVGKPTAISCAAFTVSLLRLRPLLRKLTGNNDQRARKMNTPALPGAPQIQDLEKL